jgi:hypothetical protein
VRVVTAPGLATAVPVFVPVDDVDLAAVAGLLAGVGVGLAEDVCAWVLPISITPAAKKVPRTIKGFLILLLSHWLKNSANRRQPTVFRAQASTHL